MANNINPLEEFSWSDLQQELVELIMSHVTTTFDLLQCRRVCRSWRFAATRALSPAIINGISKNTPSLLLSGKTTLSHRDHRKLLCISQNTTTEYRCYRAPNFKRLPCEVADSGGGGGDDGGATNKRSVAVPRRIRCVASYRGWLLLYPKIKKSLYLYNPLSKMVIHLPPPPKPALIIQPNQLRFITSSTLTEPTCMVYLYTTYSCESAIYRLSDRQWTPVFTRNYVWVSVIFYKGNFYSVDAFGVLRLFSYSTYKEVVVSRNTRRTTNVKFRCRYRYLVESGGGELLMVVRRLSHCKDSGGVWRSRTKLFEVFKLNWSNGEWEEVSDFGDQALFLARNDSKFVSVRHKPEYRDNSIYFIDDLGRLTNSGNEDFGRYDLGERKVEPLNLSHGYRHMQCRWFQPVL